MPPNVAAAVAAALEKLPADRFESAKAFVEALRNPAFAGATTSAVAARAAGGRWNRTTGILAAISAALVIAVLVLALNKDSSPSAEVSQFAVQFMGEREGGTPAGPGMAISDDGSRFAYLGAVGSRAQILVRERDRLDAMPVRSTDDVICCLTFAPDGQSLAYLTIPLELKVVSLRGGISRIVADSGLQDPTLYGGGVDWGPDGLVYLSMIDGIWRMPPEGGTRERVTTLRPGERTHAWVDVLPNGKGALLTVIPSASGDRTAYAIGVVDFARQAVTVLFQGVYARYAPSGHIVFVQDDGTLLAAPFDQNRLEVTGDPVALIQGVEVTRYGAGRMVLSQSGTLVYRRGRRVIDRLTWVARTGAVEEAAAPELDGTLGTARISPDGTRFVVNRGSEEGGHLWTRAVAGGEPVRHTFQGQLNWRGNWSPVGSSLYFISDRDDVVSVFVKPIDGTGTPLRLALPESRPIFEVVPIDDSTLVVRTDNQAPGSGDILLARMGHDTTVTSLVATPAEELTPAVSPDRRWLAYTSDESGSHEVYVRPFPNVTAGVFRVSRSGGTEPVWARSGRELFYRNGDGDLMAAAVVTTPTFSVRRQQVLFSAVRFKANVFDPAFDVSQDDQRFLMIRQDEPDDASETIVVLNWFTALRDVGGR